MSKQVQTLLDRLPATRIQVHADGSCKGNPGPGGYAAHIRRYETGNLVHDQIIKGGDNATTNNRMELEAAIQALSAISGDETAPIFICTDSAYVVQGMNAWIEGWKAKGWRGSDKKPVKNIELWRQLDALAEGRNVHFIHVKGHAGDPMNEEVDEIAQGEAQKRVQSALEARLSAFGDYGAQPVPQGVGAALRIEFDRTE